MRVRTNATGFAILRLFGPTSPFALGQPHRFAPPRVVGQYREVHTEGPKGPVGRGVVTVVSYLVCRQRSS